VSLRVLHGSSDEGTADAALAETGSRELAGDGPDAGTCAVLVAALKRRLLVADKARESVARSTAHQPTGSPTR